MDTTLSALMAQWHAHVMDSGSKTDGISHWELEDYFDHSERHDDNLMPRLMDQTPDLQRQITTVLPESNQLAMSIALLWLLYIHKKSPSRAQEEVYHLVAKWRDNRAMAFHKNGDQALQFLTSSLPLAPLLQLDARSTFFSAVYNYIVPQLDSHEPPREMYLHVRTQLYVALGYCALQAVPLDTNAHWHEHNWVKDFSKWKVGSTIRERELFANRLIESTLPGAYQLRAFKALDASIWLDPLNQPSLCALLPKQETRRLPLLTWHETSYVQSSPNLVSNVVRTNQAMVQTFCPTLFPLLELGCPAEDWCLQQTIVDKADALYMASQSPGIETYSLPSITP